MPPTKKAKGASGAARTNALEGLTFAISGTLPRPRKHFEDLITNNGGKVASSVTNAVRSLCGLLCDGTILTSF